MDMKREAEDAPDREPAAKKPCMHKAESSALQKTIKTGVDKIFEALESAQAQIEDLQRENAELKTANETKEKAAERRNERLKAKVSIQESQLCRVQKVMKQATAQGKRLGKLKGHHRIEVWVSAVENVIKSSKKCEKEIAEQQKMATLLCDFVGTWRD